MPQDRWSRVALVLLGSAAAVYLLEKLLQASRFFGDIILLFLLAWFVAFVLDPLARFVGKRLRRSLATAVVYLGAVIVVMACAVAFTPGLITQFSRLSVQIPEIIDQLPAFTDDAEAALARYGLQVELEEVLRTDVIAQRLGAAGSTVVQSMLSVIMGFANVLFRLLIVLLLSFYITLDGDRIARRLLRMVPRQARRETVAVVRNVARSFGGFIRGQLLQALILTAITAIVAWVAGLENVAAISLLAGLLMLIPLIGMPLSLIPPLVVAVPHSLWTALGVVAVLFVLQQVVVNVLMPRIMSGMVGLHPLLIFLALLLGLRIGGLWGGFFAIPIAGVVYATMLSLYQRGRLTGSAVD